MNEMVQKDGIFFQVLDKCIIIKIIEQKANYLVILILILKKNEIMVIMNLLKRKLTLMMHQ
jgi:predicted DNA binding protein